MTRVEIFHNTATDENGNPMGFFGYERGHEVVKVYEVVVEVNEGTEVLDLAELAFRLGNGQCQESEDYYSRMLRSVSVGDLVRVGDIWLSCDSSGWSIIEGHTPTDITDEFETRHGTMAEIKQNRILCSFRCMLL